MKIKKSSNKQLKFLYRIIKRKYPMFKYILKKKKDNQLAPQSNLINIALDPSENLSKIVNSYLLYHKIHFHLKNYLMKLRKKKKRYKNEFIDIFYDIFLDNFLIFKELSKFIKEEQSHYINIWLDCFFINKFNKIIDESSTNSHDIQPHLFFIIILFLALPEISPGFKEIPFSSVIHFHKSTQKDWKESLNLLKEIKFDQPRNMNSIEKVRLFFLNFMGLNIYINKKKELYFDDDNNMNCINFINVLIKKTEEMIKNIKKIRTNLLEIPY
jgi:hypothetical protein